MLVFKGNFSDVVASTCLTFDLVLQEGIGLIAINDSFCLEGQIYQVLRKYFRSQPYYTDIMDLFHEVKYSFCKDNIEILESLAL